MAKFELKLAKWKSISLHFCRLESLELARLAGIVHNGADIIFAKKKKSHCDHTERTQIYCLRPEAGWCLQPWQREAECWLRRRATSAKTQLQDNLSLFSHINNIEKIVSTWKMARRWRWGIFLMLNWRNRLKARIMTMFWDLLCSATRGVEQNVTGFRSSSASLAQR